MKTQERRPILLGRCTYGLYTPETKKFWCTHGAWEGIVTFIDDEYCKVSTVSLDRVFYEFIDEIPEAYNYT